MKPKAIDTLKKLEGRYCNHCKTVTRHALVAKRKQNVIYDDDSCTIHSYVSAIWKCEGCGSFTLEERYRSDEIHGPDGCGWETQFHPKRNHSEIQPKHFLKLPVKLQPIYHEVLTAFNHDAKILAAVGLRALIEGICKERAVNGKDLKQRINGLTKVLPENIVKNLHGLRFMGNDATHELSFPEEYELRLGIEICEDLLNYLYELDYKTARLEEWRSKKRTPLHAPKESNGS